MVFRPTRPQNRAEQLAARNAVQQDVFAREVDEAVRQDQMIVALRRYGVMVGAGVVLALLLLAGWLLWSNHRAAQHEARSEQLTLALDQLDAGRPAAAAAQAAALAGGGDGVAAGARLIVAGVALTAGHRDQALRQYAAIAADAAAPQSYRDLATIRAAAIDDALTPDQIIARVKPLAVPGNAWFGSAGELVGMAYLKQGRKDLAAPLFGAIAKDTDVPDSLRARARQIGGLLGFDAVADIAGETSDAAGPAASPPAPAAHP